MRDEKKLYSVAALFDTPDQIIHAAEEVNKAGYKKFDINTPYPVHGMDKAMGLKPTKLGFVTLFFGLSGASFILLFIFYAMAVDYPMVIGGKPFFAFPAYIPITFETTVLLAAISTVFGMIAVFFNLPKNNHPLLDTNYMDNVSSDKYGIVIEAEDPLFNQIEVADFLTKLGGKHIELVYFPVEEKYPIFQPKFLWLLAATAIIVSGATYITLNKLMFVTPFSWMMEQDKTIPQEKSAFFSDGFGMRKPVEGTVARGFMPYPYKGITEPTEVLTNPFLPTKENLELGKRKFLTYCSPCHGNHADGDSRLHGQFPNPPTLHSTRAREFPDGRIYHIITNGQNIMPSYAAQITREERWAIVNYIRVLQRAKNAKPSDLQAINKESVTNVEN
ncbi:MAG: quinol:electron acceptor oxidoreductase subunit ActD [Ignavibacteriaceae bacterium]